MAGAYARQAVLGAVLVAALLLLAGRADAAIYWPAGSAVTRVNTDGSWLQEHFIEFDRTSSPLRNGSANASAGCEGIAVDGSHIYWADPSGGTIDRADLDGANVNYEFVTGIESPCGVAVDASNVYWTDYRAGTIGKANLEGGEVQREFVTGLAEPCGVAVGGGYLYWTASYIKPGPDSYLARRPLAGGLPEVLIEGDGFCGTAVDATHVYWGGFNTTIGRAALDGSDPEPSFISGIERPCGIALSGPYIYWSHQGFQYRAIERTEIEGPHTVETLATHYLDDPCGVAVDGTIFQGSFPPYPAPVRGSTDEITFAQLRRAKHRPIVFLTIKFPEAGTFALMHGPAANVRVIGHPESMPFQVLGSEEQTLKIVPAAGSQGAALRARLRRRGRARITIKVKFEAAAGTGSTKRVSVLLTEPRYHQR